MSIKIGDSLNFLIYDLNKDGEGVGKKDGLIIFCPETVPKDFVLGEVTQIFSNYIKVKLIEIIEASPLRSLVPCPVFEQCGGCTLQNINYEAQLNLKNNLVEQALKRIAKINFTPDFILGTKHPWNYRNKALLHAFNKQNKLSFAYLEDKSHCLARGFSFLEQFYCYILDNDLNELVQKTEILLNKYQIKAKEPNKSSGFLKSILIRKAMYTGELMLVLEFKGYNFNNGELFAKELKKEIPALVSVLNRDILSKNNFKLLGGKNYIKDKLMGLNFSISPTSFYQINSMQVENLYKKALEYSEVSKKDLVIDAYCGIGTISLFMANKAKKVIGIEEILSSIKQAKSNAQRNQIDNVSFICDKVENILPQLIKKQQKPQIIVLNPPRGGCHKKVLEAICSSKIPRLVYISCNPATLARDIHFLYEEGYELKKVQPVDMFCQTMHVETVVLLSHKKADSYINVNVDFGEGEGKIPMDKIVERADKFKPKDKVTYKMIKEYILDKYGFKVHTAYIAEVKRSLGLPMYDAPNAVEELKQPRKQPTEVQVDAIKDALKYFEVIYGLNN